MSGGSAIAVLRPARRQRTAGERRQSYNRTRRNWSTFVVSNTSAPVRQYTSYEVTGPRPLTFAEAADVISTWSGRDVRYLSVTPDEYVAGAAAHGAPDELVEMLVHLFAELLDGRTRTSPRIERESAGGPATSTRHRRDRHLGQMINDAAPNA